MKKKLIIIGCILSIVIILLSITIVFSNMYNKNNTDYLDLFPNNISILAVIPSPKKIYKNNPIAFQIIQYITNGNDIITSDKSIDWDNPCGYCKLDNDIEWYFLSVIDKNKLMHLDNFRNLNIYFKNNYCIWNSNNDHSFQLPSETNKTLRHDSNLNNIFSKIGMPNDLFIYKKIGNETIENISINVSINDQNTLLCHGCCDIPENSSLKVLCNISKNNDSIFKYIPDNPMIASIFSLNIPEESEYMNEIVQYIFNMSSLQVYYKNNDNNEEKSLLKTFFEDIEELLKFKYKLNVKMDDILQQVQGNAIICVYSPESIQLLDPAKQVDFFPSLMVCKLFEKNKLNKILNDIKLEKNINSEGIYLAKEKNKEIYKLVIKNSLEHEQCIYFCIIDDYYFCLSSDITLVQKAQEKSSHFNKFIEQHYKEVNIPHCTIIQIDQLGKQIIQWLKQNQNNSSLNIVLDNVYNILNHFSFLTLNVFHIAEDLSLECKIQIKDKSWNELFEFMKNIEKKSDKINNTIEHK